MYLSAKQVEALRTASEALQMCLDRNIDPERSDSAITTIIAMLDADRVQKEKQVRKRAIKKQ